jgi:hypothetical protein
VRSTARGPARTCFLLDIMFIHILSAHSNLHACEFEPATLLLTVASVGVAWLCASTMQYSI